MLDITSKIGAGRWTVDMFAMFELGHTDVLPVGDLGIRNGMKYLYNLKVRCTLTDPDYTLGNDKASRNLHWPEHVRDCWLIMCVDMTSGSAACRSVKLAVP